MHYSAIKMNEILLFAVMWMELENILLSKISQRQMPYDFIHTWNLRNKTDEHGVGAKKEANQKTDSFFFFLKILLIYS